MPEPTIGNRDQECSISLMKDIVQFCDRTNITTQEIITSGSSLKTSTGNNQFQEIKAEIMKIEESSKKILRQHELKKLIH